MCAGLHRNRKPLRSAGSVVIPPCAQLDYGKPIESSSDSLSLSNARQQRHAKAHANANAMTLIKYTKIPSHHSGFGVGLAHFLISICSGQLKQQQQPRLRHQIKYGLVYMINAFASLRARQHNGRVHYDSPCRRCMCTIRVSTTRRQRVCVCSAIEYCRLLLTSRGGLLCTCMCVCFVSPLRSIMDEKCKFIAAHRTHNEG